MARTKRTPGFQENQKPSNASEENTKNSADNDHSVIEEVAMEDRTNEVESLVERKDQERASTTQNIVEEITNEVESLEEGKDQEIAMTTHNIVFPAWHPASRKINVEKLDSVQSSSKPLYNETKFYLANSADKRFLRIYNSLLQLNLEMTWTHPIIEFIA